MLEKVDPITNEHVVEIRYRHNARVLDHRGDWAERISAEMGLPEWRIVENRIDVYKDDHSEHAFIGFRHGGFTIADTNAKTVFPSRAGKLLRFVFGLREFGDRVHVERLGVRSRFCTTFAGEFAKLVDLYTEKYVSLHPAAKEAIGQGVHLLDIGAPMNFRDSLGQFNSQCGPMPQAQLESVFRKDEGYPAVGLYYDIDYFLHPGRKMDAAEVVEAITNFAHAGWDRHDRVRSAILGD